jgi:imidazole glycerol-phosphate synthase subunit HisH
METDIAVVGTGTANLYSVLGACLAYGKTAQVANDRNSIIGAKAVILPGVGSYPVAMQNLRHLGLDDALKEFVELKRPLMGICLGMQVLFEDSDEFQLTDGLGIIPGHVRKLPPYSGDRIRKNHANIGWAPVKHNQSIRPRCDWSSQPTSHFKDGECMYFMHSYHVLPKDPEIIDTRSTYGSEEICSSVVFENIFACQFHPEKSGASGLKVFMNFIDSIR